MLLIAVEGFNSEDTNSLSSNSDMHRKADILYKSRVKSLGFLERRKTEKVMLLGPALSLDYRAMTSRPWRRC